VKRIWARLAAARDPGLLICACVCGVVAAALVAVPLGWAAAGVAFVAVDLATSDEPKR
jgi:hypothetical protein